MSLPAIAMKETDAHQAFANFAAKTNQGFTTNTLFSWLNQFNFFRNNFRNDRSNWILNTVNNFSTSIMYPTIINYKNGCTFEQAMLSGDRIDQLTDDEKTNAFDTHFVRILRDNMKKCHQISYSQEFNEQMNAYNQKRPQQTLFKRFASFATCVKKDGRETCTVINENNSISALQQKSREDLLKAQKHCIEKAKEKEAIKKQTCKAKGTNYKKIAKCIAKATASLHKKYQKSECSDIDTLLYLSEQQK